MTIGESQAIVKDNNVTKHALTSGTLKSSSFLLASTLISSALDFS